MNKKSNQKPTLFHRALEVRNSNLHDYGVFATEDIKDGDVIEECQILPLNKKYEELERYYFGWPKGNTDEVVLPLGFGSIYNHSDFPNADWTTDKKRRLIIFKASRNIVKDQEIMISYGTGWFNARQMYSKNKHGMQYTKPRPILLGEVELEVE